MLDHMKDISFILSIPKSFNFYRQTRQFYGCDLHTYSLWSKKDFWLVFSKNKTVMTAQQNNPQTPKEIYSISGEMKT